MKQSVGGRWCGGGRVPSAIKSPVNARSLQLECASGLHESLLVPVLTYGSETTIRRDRALGLYRWTTSEVCWILGGWIESRIHG